MSPRCWQQPPTLGLKMSTSRQVSCYPNLTLFTYLDSTDVVINTEQTALYLSESISRMYRTPSKLGGCYLFHIRFMYKNIKKIACQPASRVSSAGTGNLVDNDNPKRSWELNYSCYIYKIKLKKEQKRFKL